MRQLLWSVPMLALAVVLPVNSLAAQGVASAAVAGRVTDEAGASVPAAQLTLANGSTGQRYTTRARDDGEYSFENVAVGGPYTLAARALGLHVGDVTRQRHRAL